MKTAYRVSGIIVAGFLAFAGCSKADKAGDRRIPATMDVAKFTQAFPSPTPQQQSNLSKVTGGVRYRLYPDALAALEGLASDPALAEPQKKAVADMIAGIRQAMTNAPAAPAQ